jgi:TM2 domain-containing membrane protein YozV
VSLRNRPRRSVAKPSTFLAVLLSLFLPGLGQISQGRGTVGAAFLIGWLLALCIAIFAWPAVLICLVVAIWACIDTASH